MKLNLLKLFTMVAAGSLFLIVFLSFRPVEKKNSEAQTASIAQAFPRAPREERILLQGPGGGVWVNNFYKTAKTALPDSNAVFVAEGASYDILYYREDSSFEIALGIYSSNTDRLAAESSMFSVLGIGKSDICKLKVTISSIDQGGNKEYSPLASCLSVFRAK